VASNAPLAKMQFCLDKTGLAPLLNGNQLFSAYDIGAWKPSPELFVTAALALGVEPRHCAVVEDSNPGVEAGIAAGMQVFALDKFGSLGQWSGVTNVTALAQLIPMFA